MKDKNGIEICCENCRCVCKYDSMCLAHTPPSFFRATSEALEARIAELQRHEQSHLEDFTIEEIDFIKKAISMAILDCETNPPKPSDEKLKLMWSIKSKCDAFLKANVRENRTVEEREDK